MLVNRKTRDVYTSESTACDTLWHDIADVVVASRLNIIISFGRFHNISCIQACVQWIYMTVCNACSAVKIVSREIGVNGRTDNGRPAGWLENKSWIMVLML